jgi:hypothetical protein
VHAYALMPNPYHTRLESPQANLVAGTKWFQGTATQRFNGRHLVQGRYKAILVEAEDE